MRWNLAVAYLGSAVVLASSLQAQATSALGGQPTPAVPTQTGTATPAPVASLASRPAPPFTPQVWDIDWSYLERQPGANWHDRLHYIPLPAGYLSFTGQIRERGEYQDHPAFGSQPPDNGYLLQRYQLSADLHALPRLRLFLQLASGLEEARDGGPRPGIDQDTLDLNQAFVDLKPLRRTSTQLTLRAGRQLISLGSTRLVAIGAGLNVQQPFDGFRALLHRNTWSVDALAVRPTSTQTGRFDNRPNSTEELWGVNLSHPAWPRIHGNVDLYYLGLDHKSARYIQGSGREQRETFGGRLWSHSATWRYDFELDGQLGSLRQAASPAAARIRAWAAGYNLSYTFADLRWQPHLELDGGFLSGDGNPHDRSLGTFNPLFPNGSYLGQSILLGPYNMVITRPTFKLSPARRLNLNTNLELLWRQSLQDGAYNIVGIPIRLPNGSRDRWLGSQVQQQVDWQFTPYLTGSLVYEHFFAGSFLRDGPPGRSVNFISPQLTYNF